MAQKKCPHGKRKGIDTCKKKPGRKPVKRGKTKRYSLDYNRILKSKKRRS